MVLLAAVVAGCGGDDYHDLSPLRTDCGQDHGPCCDGLACYNGGRCVDMTITSAGITGSCRDPELRQRNECRSQNDCGLSEQCGGAQSCLEDRVCFLCQAPFANAPRQIGEQCDGNMMCATGLCLGNICTAPCRIGPGGDGTCGGIGGSHFYCAAIQAYYLGTSGPSTTVSVCLRHCTAEAPCPTGQVCIDEPDALQRRTTPTCIIPHS